MKVLFVCPYPIGRIASQRFRFEQYLSLLTTNKIDYEIASFNSSEPFLIRSRSFKWILKGLVSRVRLLARVKAFDFVFLHREMAPVGPPLLEWLITHVWRKKIIYDLDDAIWLTDETNESWIEERLRCRSKVSSICRWSYKISCGNQYLADYAERFNQRVSINPTTIETNFQHNPDLIQKKENKDVIIGWTGSYSTLKYLRPLVPVLQALEQKHPQVNFVIIADKDPKLPLKNIRFIPWNLTTEIADLALMNIGIMPLPDDAWTRGKGGFKALQYMAMAIPAVVSPVGINKQIITHGEEGFLCISDQEWLQCLEELVVNETLRIEMGRRGRQKVSARYSVASNSENFLSLFQ